jgi:hypothetical protein
VAAGYNVIRAMAMELIMEAQVVGQSQRSTTEYFYYDSTDKRMN